MLPANQLVWKQTAISDFVIQRHCRLWKDRFVTFPDPTDPANHKTWKLDEDVQLIPATKEEIVLKHRHIRPEGSLTALAALTSKAAPIDLYTLKLKFPKHTLVSDFTFGFEDRASAERWHDLLAGVLTDLQRAGSSTGSDRPVDRASSLRRSLVRSLRGPEGNSITTGSSSARTAPVVARNSLTDSMKEAAGLCGDECDPEGECGDISALYESTLGLQSHLARRWIPYKFSNGVAIYQHSVGDGNTRGGEYMASAVVRAPPVAALRVLMDPGSATSILGPASEVEVLESEHGRQVMRLRISVAGFFGRWFRPREAVVQRLLKKEDDGVYVVLFSSLDTFDARTSGAGGGGGNSGGDGGRSAAPARRRQLGAGELDGVIEEALGSEPASVLGLAPARMRVSGGFTICRLEGARGDLDSPEALITLVLHVEDLGGLLSENSWPLGPWVRRLPLVAQAYEAYVERMLMSIILVKDQVEQGAFVVKPYALREAPVGGAGEGAVADSAEAGGVAEAPLGRAAAGKGEEEASAALSLRSPTELLRRVAGCIAPSAAPPAGAAADAAGAAASSSPPSAFMTPAASVSAGGSAAAAMAAAAAAGASSLERQGSSLLEWPAEVSGRGCLAQRYWQELHVPGSDYPFRVRGASYLVDGLKVAARESAFVLASVDAFLNDGPVEHISQYLPHIRRSPAPFTFVFNLQIPGPPYLCLVLGFAADRHPDLLGPPPEDPDEGTWSPFDYVLHRFLSSSDHERDAMIKVVPHMAEASWVVKQSVGTTPVIIGRKLGGATYHAEERYLEMGVDIGQDRTANYITGMVRGVMSTVVIDLGLVLEGTASYELPEMLLGTIQLRRLELTAARPLDTSRGPVPVRR